MVYAFTLRTLERKCFQKKEVRALMKVSFPQDTVYCVSIQSINAANRVNKLGSCLTYFKILC